MKRIWLAILFLCIALALSIFEQCKIESFHREMSEKISTAIRYEKDENSPMLKKSIDDLQSYWEKNNDIIFTMTNHGVLDELSKDIRAVNPDKVDNSLHKIEASLGVFYENQRLTFSNIF